MATLNNFRSSAGFFCKIISKALAAAVRMLSRDEGEIDLSLELSDGGLENSSNSAAALPMVANQEEAGEDEFAHAIIFT